MTQNVALGHGGTMATNNIPDAARLPDEELGPIIGIAMTADSVNTEMDLHRYVVRIAEDHAWHSRDAEVATLYQQLESERATMWEYVDQQVAQQTIELQEQLDAMTEKFHITGELQLQFRQERDAARSQRDALVEAAENMLKEDAGVKEWEAIRRAIAAARTDE